MIQDTAKGSTILMIGQIASTAISAIGSIIVARILGSTSFGIISIALIPNSFAMMLINNGVTSAITNSIVEYRHDEKENQIVSIVLAGFIINIVLGLLVTLFLYIFSGYLANQVFSKPELQQLIKILSLSVIASSIFTTSASVLTGFEKMTQRSVINIINSIFKTVIGPTLVFLGYGVVGATLGYSIPALLSGLFGVILVLVNLRAISPSFFLDIKDFSRIFSYSIPLFFSNILSSSLSNALNFILPFFVSASLIGNYRAAQSFSIFVTFFLGPLAISTFPLLSKLKPEDPVFEFVFQNIIKYETLIAYPIVAAVIALSSQMVQILYGSDYASTPLFVQVIMLRYLFIGFGGPLSSILLNSQKKTQVRLRSTVIHLLVGIPLGVFLIPRYGVIGLPITNLIAPNVALLYSLYWIRRNLGIQLDINSTLKIFISTFIGFITCHLLLAFVNSSPWVEVIIGGGGLAVTYLLSILLTGALTKTNLSDIHGIVYRYQFLRWFINPLFDVMIKFARIE
jgi:O-antigen/teichoic acid export membrane protein